jgi:uncharacterized linocin/CFP29 family protein
MSHLLREFAPITSANWTEIDSEAKDRLTPSLAARRLVDFAGPLGWEYSATNLGRVETIPGAHEGLITRRRVVLPLAEVKVPFALSRSELAAGDRGAADVDYGPLDAAAQLAAVAENSAVFHGWDEAGIDGIAPESPHDPLEAGARLEDYPSAVARGVELLLRSGVGGPYGLALGREDYTKVVESTEHGGYLLLDHLRRILGGPIVWAPGVIGGVVLSLRGGDFLFESGQDLSVGYDHHDAQHVELYLEQSFSFRVATPEAAVAITKVA